MMDYNLIVTLIVALPLLATVINGLNLLAGDKFHYKTVQNITVNAILLSFIGSVWVFMQVLDDPTPKQVHLYSWLASGDVKINIGFMIDTLSAIMMLVVTGFSVLVARFSINYMHGDYSFTRYFTALALFVYAMLILVMGNNFVMLFIGWETVGVCSYLLIGHYYQRISASRAGTKAFLMNRVGDAGFLMGLFIMATHFGSFDYAEVLSKAPGMDSGVATAIGLCLLLGAIGKSAQLPLGTWLSKAMEGPTPSSALIHAATMVTAGIYMIVRSHAIYDMAPNALLVIAIVGALTAIYGGLVGLVVTDIKGILAFSTTTQLGLMFLACGLGAYAVAINTFADARLG
jgi:NADH-quinone oxidoreductase subunit L